jgi:serine/threonine-protein kinase
VVTDFGIASTAHSDARSSDGAITGSPHYASPEQIAGQPVDAASDLYSLGVVGYYALTGRLPFDAPTVREVVGMHLTVRPPSLASVAPTVPSRLAQIVERCLSKRPEQRPADARAFAESLDQAIDPPREFPAPIRIWLARTQAPSIAKPVLAIYVTLLAGMPFVFSGRIEALPISLLTLGVLAGSIPAFVRTRGLVAEGYGIEDIRAALHNYWQQRREESAYEWSRGRRGSLTVFVGALACFGVISIAAATTHQVWFAPLQGLAAITTIVSGALSFGGRLRRKLGVGLGTRQLKFYNGKWGERFVKLAGLGIKKRVPTESLPQLTEVALGRATDALYDALPRNVKKQLAQLPETVRRLEGDARGLRAEIDKLDASLVDLDADSAGAMPSALAASEHEAGVREQRERLRADVRTTRDQAANRLAATVAALENIRLDLLRLQLGDGHVDSVTASLDAAREVASDLGAYVDATEEVERSLRPPPRLIPRTSLP